MPVETKQAIMDVIVESKGKGVKQRRICSLLQIEERRIRRWKRRGMLADRKPGPEHAPHALLAEERDAIIELAKEEAYVDDGHRVLTAKGIDAGRISVSASSVYRVMRHKGLTTDRSDRAHHSGRSRKPDRPDLTGRNPRSKLLLLGPRPRPAARRPQALRYQEPPRAPRREPAGITHALPSLGAPL